MTVLFGLFLKEKCSKLDRFLVNSVWLESGAWSVKALCRLSSDHKPILLSCKYISWSPKCFEGFNWWLQEDSLTRELKMFWQENNVANSEKNFIRY